MQLRKLIRLLEEAKEKYGDRIECCIDTELGASNRHLKYYSISDIEHHSCVWNPEETENECQRFVLVLGNI